MNLFELVKGIRFALLPDAERQKVIKSYGIYIRLEALEKIGGRPAEEYYNKALEMRLATGESIEEILDMFMRFALPGPTADIGKNVLESEKK